MSASAIDPCDEYPDRDFIPEVLQCAGSFTVYFENNELLQAYLDGNAELVHQITEMQRYARAEEVEL